MADGYGFGRIGGHGGAQEKVQRIPMIIRVPGEPPSTRTVPMRLMDVAPEVIDVLRLDG
jgi:arylsulfatase A-like enzyme